MTPLFKTSLFVFIITSLAMVVFPVAAKITTFDGCTTLGIACGTTGSGTQDLICYIYTIGNGLLALVAIVAVIFIVIAGVKYITSQGDEKKADEAKHMILYTVIGLVIIGLSAVIVNFTLNLFSAGGSAATSCNPPAP